MLSIALSARLVLVTFFATVCQGAPHQPLHRRAVGDICVQGSGSCSEGGTSTIQCRGPFETATNGTYAGATIGKCATTLATGSACSVANNDQCWSGGGQCSTGFCLPNLSSRSALGSSCSADGDCEGANSGMSDDTTVSTAHCTDYTGGVGTGTCRALVPPSSSGGSSSPPPSTPTSTSPSGGPSTQQTSTTPTQNSSPQISTGTSTRPGTTPPSTSSGGTPSRGVSAVSGVPSARASSNASRTWHSVSGTIHALVGGILLLFLQ
ncbi:hypothetical protein T439DRAFT_324640 [Meredithblackwellia eburnea MCA 4105]